MRCQLPPYFFELYILGYLGSNDLAELLTKLHHIQYIRIHTIAALCGSEVSREYPYWYVFLCCKRSCFSSFKKKDKKIQKILKDINFIPHLSYLSHIFGVMNHCCCYLQGPGCNIVDLAIKLTIFRVGKNRL